MGKVRKSERIKILKSKQSIIFESNKHKGLHTNLFSLLLLVFGGIEGRHWRPGYPSDCVHFPDVLDVELVTVAILCDGDEYFPCHSNLLLICVRKTNSIYCFLTTASISLLTENYTARE